MPCDQQRTTQIQWGKNTNPDLLRAAIETLGIGAQVQYDSNNHKLTIRTNNNSDQSAEDIEREVKKAYSAQIVSYAARVSGFQQKSVKNNTRVFTKR